MKRLSFRSIIVITLIGVIGLVSSTAFYVYSIYLKELIQAEEERKAEFERGILAAFDLLKEQFYYSIDDHDGSVIKTILQRMLCCYPLSLCTNRHEGFLRVITSIRSRPSS